jgi:hypothetical protein
MTSQKTEPLELARAKWRSSGLDDKTAKRLGFKARAAIEMIRLYPKFADTCALEIPYPKLNGKPGAFKRWRRLEAPKGFAAMSGKVQRYAQPPNTTPEVYLPPLGKRRWADVLRDPAVPIIITEGELKAACAMLHGFYCVGLGGVDSWRSRKKFIELVEVLKEAEWTGRAVTIVYDSDAATNPSVMQASHGLGTELRALGAEVAIASLPAALDGSKQGLDDFLVAHGREAFEKVLDAAEPLDVGDPLWQMNSDVVFVRDPGLVMVRASGQKLTPDNFVRHHFVNRHHQVWVDGKPKQVDTAKEWMRWPHRFETEKLVYEPGRPQIHEGCFNTWKGLGVEPVKGDIGPFIELFEFVFAGLTKEEKRWVWQWLAYPLQHLGEKLYSCIALWSPVQGVGKTLVAYIMKDIYGKANAHEIKHSDLESNFNSFIENKQFIIGDEITGNDSRGFADVLKGYVTQEYVRVNAKYVPEYTVKDCANWMFTSNHPDAFYLDDSDRRFFVHHVKAEKPREAEFYKRVDAWRKKLGGPSFLLHHLLHVDLEGFNPKGRAPTTAAKEAMVYDAKSEVARWVSDLKNDPNKVLKLGSLPLKKDLYTPAELLSLFDPLGVKQVKANGLGRELAKVFQRLPKNATSNHGSQNLYAVRNVERWLKATPRQRAEHWEAPVTSLEAKKASKY